MNEAFIEMCRRQVKTATVIACYSGPAFCAYDERCKRSGEVLGKRASKPRPGVLRTVYNYHQQGPGDLGLSQSAI